PFPFPQILRLRVDLQREVVIAEGVGRAAFGHEDLGLEPERAHAAAVQSQGLVRGGLGRLEPADPQEAFADGSEGFRKVLEPRGWLPHFEEAERFDECDRRAGFGSCVQCGDACVDESVHFFEDASITIEEALVEGHPYHPIPRDVAPWRARRTSGRHAKWMTYRYRQGAAPPGQSIVSRRSGGRRRSG